MLNRIIQTIKALVGMGRHDEAPNPSVRPGDEKRKPERKEKLSAEHPDSIYPLW
jgi:hypothetical protein